MHKILLLTDFSPRNRYAEMTALNLCTQLQFDLLVMNNYDSIPLIPFANGGSDSMVSSGIYDETQEEMITKVKQIREELSKMPDSGYVPKVRSVVTEGDIGIKVSHIIPREDIELVVMGTSRGNSFEHLLIGNVLRAVMSTSSCPVLVVPEVMPQEKIDKVIFTTDFHIEDVNALSYLARLGRVLRFSIEVVHVYRPSSKIEENRREFEFIKRLEDFHDIDIYYTHLVGENLVKQINSLCKQGSEYWLAMADYQRNMLLPIFHQSTILKATKKPLLPTLILPKLLLPARYFLKNHQPKKGE
ncbi:universal stress protein [Pedobacter sp. Du54]|uniref:universal stress protein n=1 Tax=Pedobacter anseongensis TaxID=3133439 RepID=UPI0030A9B3EF